LPVLPLRWLRVSGLARLGVASGLRLSLGGGRSFLGLALLPVLLFGLFLRSSGGVVAILSLLLVALLLLAAFAIFTLLIASSSSWPVLLGLILGASVRGLRRLSLSLLCMSTCRGRLT